MESFYPYMHSNFTKLSVNTFLYTYDRYIETSQMSSLKEVFISKANAKQRQGRAGRVREGFCFRLYTNQKWVTVFTCIWLSKKSWSWSTNYKLKSETFITGLTLFLFIYLSYSHNYGLYIHFILSIQLETDGPKGPWKQLVQIRVLTQPLISQSLFLQLNTRLRQQTKGISTIPVKIPWRGWNTTTHKVYHQEN